MKVPTRVLPWIPSSAFTPPSYNGQALITFSYDDGALDNYDVAAPLHEEYGIPATFHCIGNRTKTGPNGNFMDVTRMKDLARRGFEISSHSFGHGRFPEMTDHELHWDLFHANKVISEACGVPVTTMAVPNSKYDERTRGIASAYYDAVRVFGSAYNSIPPYDPLWLNAVIATENTTTFADLKAVVDFAVANTMWAILMLHTVKSEPTARYDIATDVLKSTLEYVAELSPSQVLPVTLYQGYLFSTSSGGA